MHAQAYLLAALSASSKKSMPTRPSTLDTAYPLPSGVTRMQRVWNLSRDSRCCSGSAPCRRERRSYTFTRRPAVATTSRVPLADME